MAGLGDLNKKFVGGGANKELTAIEERQRRMAQVAKDKASKGLGPVAGKSSVVKTPKKELTPQQGLDNTIATITSGLDPAKVTAARAAAMAKRDAEKTKRAKIKARRASGA